jgi:hypothetical protein
LKKQLSNKIRKERKSKQKSKSNFNSGKQTQRLYQFSIRKFEESFAIGIEPENKVRTEDGHAVRWWRTAMRWWWSIVLSLWV